MFLVIKTSVLFLPCNVLKLTDVACLTCTYNLEGCDPIVLWLKHSCVDSKSGCIYFIHLLTSHNQLKLMCSSVKFSYIETVHLSYIFMLD